MHLLIDGDGFVYRCGFAVEKTKYAVTFLPSDIKGEEGCARVFFCDTHKEAKAYSEKEALAHQCSLGHIWSRKEIEPIENALALVKGALAAMPEATDGEIWLSGVGNFRDTIATVAKYKGNRDAVARPTYYKEIIAYLKDEYKARLTEGEEADDALGYRSAQVKDPVIVSFDKDLDQIPGKHYNWVTKEFYEVTPKQGSLNFYTQVLAGDPVDNVPGIVGIGPAKARKLLEGVSNPREAWIAALEAYTAAYGPQKGPILALETARLVYVRRKEGEIWEPPV